MNRALWKLSIREARWLLLGSTALMFAFQWVRVALIGQMPIGNFRALLKLLPPATERLAPMSWEQLASTMGRVAAGYNEPLVVLTMTVWAVARGSDAVSGPLSRGTLEMVLAQPVRRLTVIATQSAVTLLGAAALALAPLLGTMAGVTFIQLEEPVAIMSLLPAVLNLFALTTFLAGASTLVSSCDHSRGRTIGIMGSFYVFATVLKIVGRISERWHWLLYGSFFTAFEPARLAMRGDAWQFISWSTDGSWQLGGLGFSGILLGLGAAGFVAGAVIFCRRDLPAPL